MNAHTRHGYTTSDLVDYRIARRLAGHLPSYHAGVVCDLERAGDYRRKVLKAKVNEYGLIVEHNTSGNWASTDMTPASAKLWARHYITKAREWRAEVLELIIKKYDDLIVTAINAREWDAVDTLLNERLGFLRLAVRAER